MINFLCGARRPCLGSDGLCTVQYCTAADSGVLCTVQYCTVVGVYGDSTGSFQLQKQLK